MDKDYLAGIFLADDFTLVAVEAHDNAHLPPYRFDGVIPPRRQTSGALTVEINSAVEEIAGLLPSGGKIASVAIAMPGPIVVGKEKNHVTTSYHRKEERWTEVQIAGEFKKACAKAGVGNRLTKEPKINAYPDAAAYAYGDYYLSDPAEGTVLAHLMVDEGVGGAVVVNGNLMRTPLHAEIGHLPIRRHELDEFKPECSAHSYSGCAERFLSLPALRRRWGANVEEELRTWDEGDLRLHVLASYVAQLCVSLVLTVAPSRITLSGRVSRNEHLVRLADKYMKRLLEIPDTNLIYPGYEALNSGAGFVERRRKAHAGIYGCLLLARKTLTEPTLIRQLKR